MTPAEVSKLLFEARELIDMYGDVVARATGCRAAHVDDVRDRLDAYRAARGWSRNGFGGES